VKVNGLSIAEFTALPISRAVDAAGRLIRFRGGGSRKRNKPLSVFLFLSSELSFEI